MTDKEKAWAYDGALNRAKAAIDNAADKDLVKGVVTAIFPRLREGQENDVIDIPFGAHDSELKGWEYTIPEGFTAEIKDGKVIVRGKESEDERIRKWMINQLSAVINTESAKEFDSTGYGMAIKALSWLEKQKEQKPTNSEKPKEWSEEDKDYYDTIVRKLEVIGDDSGLSNNQIKFLREHCPSHYLEWSEEDENNLNKLLQWDGIPLGLRSWVSGLPEKVGTRPSWKPSEEQMEALRSVLEHEAERVGTSKYLEKANFLYEQLEKLI